MFEKTFVNVFISTSSLSNDSKSVSIVSLVIYIGQIKGNVYIVHIFPECSW